MQRHGEQRIRLRHVSDASSVGRRSVTGQHYPDTAPDRSTRANGTSRTCLKRTDGAVSGARSRTPPRGPLEHPMNGASRTAWRPSCCAFEDSPVSGVAARRRQRDRPAHQHAFALVIGSGSGAGSRLGHHVRGGSTVRARHLVGGHQGVADDVLVQRLTGSDRGGRQIERRSDVPGDRRPWIRRVAAICPGVHTLVEV